MWRDIVLTNPIHLHVIHVIVLKFHTRERTFGPANGLVRRSRASRKYGNSFWTKAYKGSRNKLVVAAWYIRRSGAQITDM